VFQHGKVAINAKAGGRNTKPGAEIEKGPVFKKGEREKEVRHPASCGENKKNKKNKIAKHIKNAIK